MNKFVLKSKTIIGLMVSAVPTLAVLLGITLTDDDTVLITQTSDAIIQLIGLTFAAYGRIKAKGGIYV